MSPEIGKLVVAVGAMLVLIGLVIWRFPNAFSWFGKLPGDISMQKGGSSFYFPIVTCILISLALTLLSWLFRR